MYPGKMQTVKEQVLRLIERLPEDADFRDIYEEIALLSAVAEAEDDIQQGNVIRNVEMASRLDEWLNG